MEEDFDPIAEAKNHWAKRWPEHSSYMAAATSIMRAQQLILKATDDALRPYGLTFARYEALMLLSFTKRGELPLSKLGQRLMIHPTSVTNIVDRLAQDGLIERVPHPTDRRTTLAKITDLGKKLAEEATVAVHEVNFGISHLTDDDNQDVVRVVNSIRNLRK
ncbi:MAG: MarR family transcriptional regulator [Actinomycetota bacterium]|nr:MarR family transcriptional regulator [Actinomycetota bacterium]